MGVLILGEDRLEFDVVISEERALDSLVTAHPVARGVEVVDHQQPSPLPIQLRVWVSETPRFQPSFGVDDAQIDPSLAILGFDSSFNRVRSFLDRLRQAQANGERATYIGELGRVENLLVVSVSSSQSDLAAAELTIRLKQILVADATLVPLPVTQEPRGSRRRSRGKQPSKETSETENASFLANLLGV